MWFLIRSAFWLGLLFHYMDWRGEAPSPPDAAMLTQAVAAQAVEACHAAPKACLDMGRVILPKLAPGVGSFVASPKARAKASADTLRGADRAASWRGGTG